MKLRTSQESSDATRSLFKEMTRILKRLGIDLDALKADIATEDTVMLLGDVLEEAYLRGFESVGPLPTKLLKLEEQAHELIEAMATVRASLPLDTKGKGTG